MQILQDSQHREHSHKEETPNCPIELGVERAHHDEATVLRGNDSSSLSLRADPHNS